MIGSVEVALLILLAIIIAGPILAERLKIPGLIGLIFLGMVVGPFMLGWVRGQGLVSDLGEIGLLYLMFLAGLSFNIRAFMENRSNALVYGLLGFAIPFGLSYYFSITFIELGVLGALLVGAMWASNTLVAYPDVLAAGLQNNKAVSAAVSAGVVADLLSLTVLGVVTSTAVIEIEPLSFVEASMPNPSLPIWLGLPVLAGFSLSLLPRITEWFFVRVGHTRTQRFVFALAGMAAASTVALLGGVEGLIGAFLAGLGMNQLIPARGALMDRLDFVGGAIFVPAFLVSIGLAIDPAAIFDVETIVLAVFFTLLVVVGKTLAAVIDGAIFRLAFMDIGLMASLSTGQAASTLAIAQVGASLNLLSQEVVNASILTVVLTAFITSFGTRFFASRVERPPLIEAPLGDAVLVDVRALDSDITSLMAIAGAMARSDRGVVIPYMVPATGHVEVARTRVDLALKAAAAVGHDASGEIRVDDSFPGGTINLAEEVGASFLLLNWRASTHATDFMLGNEIDLIGERSATPTGAVRVFRPWNRIVVFTGEISNDWNREDVWLALSIAGRIRKASDVPILVFSSDVEAVQARVNKDPGVEVTEASGSVQAALDLITKDDLVVAPAHVLASARSFGPWRLMRGLRDISLMVVAGPHRLSVARSSVQRNLHGIVDATDQTYGRQRSAVDN
ncbi:MAG: cation:proton antiporter [Acidimicrobiia bacterium]